MVNDLEGKDFNLKQTQDMIERENGEEEDGGTTEGMRVMEREKGRERMHLNFYVSKNPCFW